MRKKKTDNYAQELIGQLASIHTLMTRLSEQERQIDAFFNLSQDIFMIVEETTGTIVRVNPTFERVLGWSALEAVGRLFQEYVVENDVERTGTQLKKIVEEQRGDESTFVNQYRCRDGSAVTLDWRSTPPTDGFIYAVARVLD